MLGWVPRFMSLWLLGSVMDSMPRNTPEAQAWIRTAQEKGVAAAVAERDGPSGDCSQSATDEGKPNRNHVVYAGSLANEG